MKKIFRWLKKWFDGTKYKFVILSNYIKYGREIKKEIYQNPQSKLDKKQRRQIKTYFGSYGFHIRLLWHEYYGGHAKEFSKHYIPQDLFFSYIEIALNRYDYVKLQDKNMLDHLFTGIVHLKIIFKNINGFYQTQNRIISKEQAISALTAQENFIIKPTIETSGGKNVEKIDFTAETKTEVRKQRVEKLLNAYQKDFVVQEVLDQSAVMSKLNPCSLNTIRICTYLNDKGVVVLFSLVRFGKEGAFLDNITQGGFYCKVNEDGSLGCNAYNTLKKTITETEGGTVFQDFVIPNYDKVKTAVNNLHQQVPCFRLVSWDIALDSAENPVLIEYNVFGQSIDFQAITGPLFGKYTDEILEITQKYRREYL